MHPIGRDTDQKLNAGAETMGQYKFVKLPGTLKFVIHDVQNRYIAEISLDVVKGGGIVVEMLTDNGRSDIDD